MKVSNQCSHCLAASKSVQRDISAQTWSALIHWGEVDASVVDKPLCAQCHHDIRDLLIERSSEFASYIEAGTRPVIKMPAPIPLSQPAAATIAKAARRPSARKAIA